MAFAYLILIIGLLFGGVTLSESKNLTLQAERVRAEVATRNIKELGRYIERFADERLGVYPVSLAALAATPGYESAGSMLTAGVRYARSGFIDDGIWEYERAVVYRQDSDTLLTDEEYLSAAQNACGDKKLTQAIDWCGNEKSKWLRVESRERFPGRIIKIRKGMSLTLNKFAAYFPKKGGFPDTDSTNNPVALGSPRSLKSLVGYTGTVTNCAGVFLFEEVALGCDDLFSPESGGPISYALVTPTHISLYVGTGIVNSDYEEVIIAQEIGI